MSGARRSMRSPGKYQMPLEPATIHFVEDRLRASELSDDEFEYRPTASSCEDASPYRRRSPGPDASERRDWSLSKDWQQSLRQFLQDDFDLKLRLEDFSEVLVQTTGFKNVHGIWSVLLDAVWASMIHTCEAMREGRLQAPAEVFNGDRDRGYRDRFEALQTQFFECRAAYLEEVSSARDIRRDKVWTTEFQEAFEAAMDQDVYRFLPDGALSKEQRPYFKQALEECLKTAMVKNQTAPPGCENCKLLQRNLAKMNSELAQMKLLRATAKAPEKKQGPVKALQEVDPAPKVDDGLKDLLEESEKIRDALRQTLRVLGASSDELQAVENRVQGAAEALRARLFKAPERKAPAPAPAPDPVPVATPKPSPGKPPVAKKVAMVQAGDTKADDEKLAELQAKLTESEKLRRQLQAEVEKLKAQLAKAGEAPAPPPPPEPLASPAPTSEPKLLMQAKEIQVTILDGKPQVVEVRAPAPQPQVVEVVKEVVREPVRVEEPPPPPKEDACKNCEVLERTNKKLKQRVKELEGQLSEAQRRIEELEAIVAKLRGLVEEMKEKLSSMGVDTTKFEKVLWDTGVDKTGIKPLRKVFDRLWQDAVDRDERRIEMQEAARLEDLMGAAFFKMNPEVVMAALKAATEALNTGGDPKDTSSAQAAVAAAIAALAAQGLSFGDANSTGSVSYQPTTPFTGLQQTGKAADRGKSTAAATPFRADAVAPSQVSAADAAGGQPLRFDAGFSIGNAPETDTHSRRKTGARNAVSATSPEAAHRGQAALSPAMREHPVGQQAAAAAQRASDMRDGGSFEDFVRKAKSQQAPSSTQTPQTHPLPFEDDDGQQSVKPQMLSALLFGPSRLRHAPSAAEEEGLELLATGQGQLVIEASGGSNSGSRPRSAARPHTLQPLAQRTSQSNEGGIEVDTQESRERRRPSSSGRPSSSIHSGRPLSSNSGVSGESFSEAMRRSAAAALIQTSEQVGDDASPKPANNSKGLSSLLKGQSKSLPQLGGGSQPVDSWSDAWRITKASEGASQAASSASTPARSSSRANSRPGSETGIRRQVAG
mmetsp:Transcript_26441/g.47703  ORF Transcript_26441/g.47703 Transcript_26441/m.47703 type:complete len:1052 (+) Transcript_26441:56-3211(+)